jgi:hypothetical protein
MSALGQQRTSARSFNYNVVAHQERLRDREAKRLSGLKMMAKSNGPTAATVRPQDKQRGRGDGPRQTVKPNNNTRSRP